MKRFFSNIVIPASTKYGGRYTVTMIPGDGIGRELCNSVKAIFQVLNVPVDFEEVSLSGYTATDATLRNAIESIKRNKICIKGILHTQTTPTSLSSFNVAIRKELNVYANVSIVRNFKRSPTSPISRHTNVDFVVIRENTEGEYSGLEHQSVPGVIESLKVITKEKSEKIVKFAFDFAIKNERKKITCVHKANIMKLADGLFLRTFNEVAQTYKSSNISIDSMIVDNTAMQLVSRPHQFDVIVTPNLYGNIVTNIGAGLVGGPGFIPGYNIGSEYALYEPGSRHVGKDIEGRDMANPVSLLLSATFMLEHLGLHQYSTLIRQSIEHVFATNSEFCQPIFSTKRFMHCLLDSFK